MNVAGAGSGIHSVIAVDHGLSLDELGNFEDAFLERLRGSVFAVTGIKDVTRTDRQTTPDERKERLRQNDWLYFEAADGAPLECMVGKRAVAVILLGTQFIWGDAESSGLTGESIYQVIEELLSAFVSSHALIAPSGRYYPGGWVTELACEGLSIAEIVSRIASKGEPAPLGRDSLMRFLNSRGPARTAMLREYFLITDTARRRGS